VFRCDKEEEAEQWVGKTLAAVDEAEERCRRSEWSFVYCNVYDLGTDRRVGFLNSATQHVLGVGGIFHTGIEVYGREYMYGIDADDAASEASGVAACSPKRCLNHTFRTSECVGLTGYSRSDVESILGWISGSWPSKAYRLFGPNCVTFSRDLCRELGVDSPPAWVDALARRVGERNILEAKPESGSQDGRVRCLKGHTCSFQAQSYLAQLVECIECDSCMLTLPSGQAHWHCDVCNTTTCLVCASDCPKEKCPR
jgi:hypothetical protein